MTILKLKEAGDEAVLAIAAVEVVKGDYGEQVKFTTASGDVLFVPSSSVERQLDRVGVAEIADLAGLNVHFSRAASKPGKAPYWNLDRAREGDPAPKTNGAPPKAEPYESPRRLPNEEPTGFSEILKQYDECISESIGFAHRIVKAGIPGVDGSTVSSLAATLMIARQKANA
jgi:hypothetical protein